MKIELSKRELNVILREHFKTDVTLVKVKKESKYGYDGELEIDDDDSVILTFE